MRPGWDDRAGLAAVDRVDVERGVGAVAQVVLGSRRPGRPEAADVGQDLVAAEQLLPGGELGRRRRADAGPQLLAQPAVGAGQHVRELAEQDVQRVEHAAAVQPGVQVAAAVRTLRCSCTTPRSPTVSAGVSRSGTPLSNTIAASAPRGSVAHPLGHRFAADLLLALDEHAHVDRQLAGAGQLAGDVQERQEVALVIGRAARVQPAVADLRRERRRAPRPARRPAPWTS